MAHKLFVLLALIAFSFLASADVYLHFPRGQNDRCDEMSNNRNNEQRCWDSENNAAGGYSTCDREMFFYEGTSLHIEWYSQHNCGNGAQTKSDPTNPELVNCNIVIQLGCEEDMRRYSSEGPGYYMTDGTSLGRPGADSANPIGSNPLNIYNVFGDTCTETRPTSATCSNGANNDPSCATLDLSNGGNKATFNSDTCSCSPRKMKTYCYHEPEAFWLKCFNRQRNMGLFTADQNPSNNQGATADRQQPNSARYGFECPEERDYWPYWHPTPWRDLVVLTSNTSMCNFYQTNSQNVMDKCECVDNSASATPTTQALAQSYNQEVSCTGGNFAWNCTGNSWNWPQPACILAPAQSDNMLGRVDTRGDNPESGDGSSLAHYDWVIPTGTTSLIPAGQNQTRCLIRLRYNLSNAEVLQNYDYTKNSMVKTNPVRTVGLGNSSLPANVTIPLRMAVNTAQYGRTFEDRTYIFSIVQRPSNLASATILNLNVRGKRGNIAQVRNCFEYDFVPQILYASVGDYVHFQWCGSDYNDPNNAGEGFAGSDRINVVNINSFNANIPVAFNATNLTSIFSLQDMQALAWLNQDPANCYSTQQMLSNNNNGNDPMACHFLNGVRDPITGLPTAYFSYLAQVIRSGVFQYICSRNNNFTNRSNKAAINIGVPHLTAGQTAGIVIGTIAGVAAIGGLAFLAVKKGGLAMFSKKV